MFCLQEPTSKDLKYINRLPSISNVVLLQKILQICDICRMVQQNVLLINQRFLTYFYGKQADIFNI